MAVDNINIIKLSISEWIRLRSFVEQHQKALERTSLVIMQQNSNGIGPTTRVYIETSQTYREGVYADITDTENW